MGHPRAGSQNNIIGEGIGHQEKYRGNEGNIYANKRRRERNGLLVVVELGKRIIVGDDSWAGK